MNVEQERFGVLVLFFAFFFRYETGMHPKKAHRSRIRMFFINHYTAR